MLVVQVLLCANSSGHVHANTFRKKLKWKAPWSTAASPYAGKWVSSRDSWLCQVWQKWPVFSLWLLLMLNYINYECGSQRAWGGSSISVSLLKAVPYHSSSAMQHWATDTVTRLRSALTMFVCVCRNAPSRSSAGQTHPPQRSRCHGQGHWVPSGWWTSEQVNALSWFISLHGAKSRCDVISERERSPYNTEKVSLSSINPREQ